jgi:proteasome activator subunit 4
VLCFPTLFNALAAGTDPDRMKGALYVLRYNGAGIGRIAREWRQLLQLTECLLGAHHENKASVQALVTKATDELISKMKEPESFNIDVQNEAVDAAADAIVEIISVKPSQAVVDSVHRGEKEKIAKQDEQYDLFVDRVIAISQSPALNWRYVLSTCRFLYNVTRRDRPTDMRLLKFFLGNIPNAHPRIRDYGVV